MMDVLVSATDPVSLIGGGNLVMTTQTVFLTLAAVVLFFFAKTIFWVFLYPFYFSPLRNIPGPKDNAFVLGQCHKLLEASWVPHLFHDWSTSLPEAPFIRYLGVGNAESLIVNNITAYHEILQTKCTAFVKPDLTRKTAVAVIGEGLPFAEGHTHRIRRGVLNKAFSVTAIKKLMPSLASKANKLVDTMAVQRNNSGEVEVESLIWKAVLDVIGTKVFGVDLDHLTSTSPVADFHTLFSRTMQQSLSSHIIHYLNSYLPLRHLIPIESNRQFLKDTDEVRSMIWGYVSERQSSIQRQSSFPMKTNDDEDVGAIPDAIELMLKQGNMSHDEIVEYALNLLVLGHDTTACTLVWAVYCLAQNPAYQERLRQDIQQRTERGMAPDYGEVERMRSLDNFLKEVLRMFCPVAYIPREATEDIEVAGVLLPKGTNVQLCPAVVNLSPSIWGSDAALFRPDRWDNLEGEAASAYAFQSFHNGPRVCIGKLLSMVEMKVFLIELLSRYRVEAIVEGEALKFASPSFTLRPHEKLRVRLVDIL